MRRIAVSEEEGLQHLYENWAHRNPHAEHRAYILEVLSCESIAVVGASWTHPMDSVSIAVTVTEDRRRERRQGSEGRLLAACFI